MSSPGIEGSHGGGDWPGGGQRWREAGGRGRCGGLQERQPATCHATSAEVVPPWGKQHWDKHGRIGLVRVSCPR
jgi:hypothetical protein